MKTNEHLRVYLPVGLTYSHTAFFRAQHHNALYECLTADLRFYNFFLLFAHVKPFLGSTAQLTAIAFAAR